MFVISKQVFKGIPYGFCGGFLFENHGQEQLYHGAIQPRLDKVVKIVLIIISGCFGFSGAVKKPMNSIGTKVSEKEFMSRIIVQLI